MGEVAVRIAVHAYALDSHSLEKPRHYNSSDGIDSIEHHLESRSFDRLGVNVFELEYLIQMPVSEILLNDCPYGINICKVEVSGLGAVQNCLAFSGIEELALLIEELEGIPLPRVVGGCENDPAVSFRKNDCHFCRRCGSQTRLDDIHTAGCNGAANQILDHLA